MTCSLRRSFKSVRNVNVKRDLGSQILFTFHALHRNLNHITTENVDLQGLLWSLQVQPHANFKISSCKFQDFRLITFGASYEL